MEARAKIRENRETGHAAPADGLGAAANVPAAHDRFAAAAGVSAAYDQYSASLYDQVRGLVDDDEKANRIVWAAFIAASQTFGANGEQQRLVALGAPVTSPAASGVCPSLGYADDPGNHYSRPTQMHRCYASGAGARVSPQEQNRLCLSGRFGDCPRLLSAAVIPMAGHDVADPGPASVPAEPVRLVPSADPVPASAAPEPVRSISPASDTGAANRKPGRPTPLEAAVTRRLRAPMEPDSEPTPDPVLPSTEARYGGLMAIARRSILAVAVLSVAVAVVGVALVFRPWDDIFGLPPEDEILQLSSRVDERAGLSPAPQENVPSGQAAIADLIVPRVAGAQSGPAPDATDPPEVGVKPNADLPAVNAPAERAAPAVRKTTRAPAGFAGANLRERPSTSARSLTMLPNGAPVDILPETASSDGFTWVHARTANGVEGWIVSTAVAG